MPTTRAKHNTPIQPEELARIISFPFVNIVRLLMIVRLLRSLYPILHLLASHFTYRGIVLNRASRLVLYTTHFWKAILDPRRFYRHHFFYYLN
jgi:hypothetical protein